MGLCNSKPSYIASSAGGERDYQDRFLESKTLGQGEFGVVKLVHDVKTKDLIGAKPMAVKYLRKGFTFRDNTLYSPLKKEVLQGEVEILRRLNGECYNLKLVAVYESPSMIYMVTEYCEGGEMVPWVSTAFKDASGLRTEDVSRICYQLWSAVDHCARHRIIHRDIKPENIMFANTERDSELRLIDFGSGTLDGFEQSMGNNGEDSKQAEVERHHTFAGSAFYISPEMFQRTYTSKTDVWSAGAALYVLVAGYPADNLQETFNVLQSSKASRLINLPNLPDNMPDSFYEMLEGALVYRHKQRMDAGQLMQCEFSQFHIHHKEQGQGGTACTISIHDIAADAAREHSDGVSEMSNTPRSLKKTTSVLLEGSVSRHNAYLGYQKFERSVTTVLATMLSKGTCQSLLLKLRETVEVRENAESVSSVASTEKKEEAKDSRSNSKANADKLQVVRIKVLLEVLGDLQVEDDREVKEVIAMVKSMKTFALYETFAYHISLLRQFVSIHARNQGAGDNDDANISSVHGNNVWNSLKKKRGLDGSGKGDPDSSIKSAGGSRSIGVRRISTATGNLSAMA
ncbi:hypothetical protein ACHAXR_008017 [Thalassiosira sp. AJA248-18]